MPSQFLPNFFCPYHKWWPHYPVWPSCCYCSSSFRFGHHLGMSPVFAIYPQPFPLLICVPVLGPLALSWLAKVPASLAPHCRRPQSIPFPPFIHGQWPQQTFVKGVVSWPCFVPVFLSFGALFRLPFACIVISTQEMANLTKNEFFTIFKN